MSALVSSTSPQVGHEALMVVTAAIPFPHRWVMKASAVLAKCLTGQNGTLSQLTSPHGHMGHSGPSTGGPFVRRQGQSRLVTHRGGDVGGFDDPAEPGQSERQAAQPRLVAGTEGDRQSAVRALLRRLVRVVVGDPPGCRRQLESDKAVLGGGRE